MRSDRFKVAPDAECLLPLDDLEVAKTILKSQLGERMDKVTRKFKAWPGHEFWSITWRRRKRLIFQ